MAGYFKVSLEAGKAIADQSDGPHALAGYVVACSGAFDEGRWQTASGAKRIMTLLGCTDWRSKKIMDELRSYRFGERGERGLLTPTGRTVGRAKATVYRIEEWPGEMAYLPSILVEAETPSGTPISRLVNSTDHQGATLKDALLLLLYIYANTDYADWFGCPPDVMATMKWRTDGMHHDFELGHVGDIGDYSVWLIAQPLGDDAMWNTPSRVITKLYGSDLEAAKARFWAAMFCLRHLDLVVDVLAVKSKNWSYPLWIFSPAYRQALEAEFGHVGDLGDQIHRSAGNAGFDPDNYIIQAATSGDLDEAGTGIFFCVGASVSPMTVLAPRLHAPTPTNLDGIRAAAEVTAEISRDLRLAVRGGEHEAA